LDCVALTGATGFIGSHLAEALMNYGFGIRLFVRRKTGFIDNIEARGAKVFVSRPDDRETLEKTVKDADTVIHCAGLTKALREQDYIDVNANLTKNILDLLDRQQKFIFLSSQAASGPSNNDIPIDENTPQAPITYYGKSKLMAECYIEKWAQREHGRYTILRPSVVYGPRERDMYCMFRLIKRGVMPLLNGGRMRLSIIHVDDLVNAIIKAALTPCDNQTYFVSGDNGYSWKEVCETIQWAVNRAKVLKINLPVSAISPIACLFDTVALARGKPALLNSQKLIEIRQSSWLCSNSKIKTHLKWKPEISLKEGILRTAQWYFAQGWLR